ncbi:hypothetical protein BC827DRAFT_1297322 [Russula dissimulans]|nr:hypothetical protein BC827DRAFT_1297322 [Russula dissimulans]
MHYSFVITPINYSLAAPEKYFMKLSIKRLKHDIWFCETQTTQQHIKLENPGFHFGFQRGKPRALPGEAAVARLRFRNAGKGVVEKKYSTFLTRADAIDEGVGIGMEGRAGEQNRKTQRQMTETQLEHVMRQSVHREGPTGEWMSANPGPRDFMAGHWRINAIHLSFQISRMTPAMMATMTVSKSCFLDTGSTAELAVADDDGENNVNGNVEGGDMRRGERDSDKAQFGVLYHAEHATTDLKVLKGGVKRWQDVGEDCQIEFALGNVGPEESPTKAGGDKAEVEETLSYSIRSVCKVLTLLSKTRKKVGWQDSKRNGQIALFCTPRALTLEELAKEDTKAKSWNDDEVMVFAQPRRIGFCSHGRPSLISWPWSLSRSWSAPGHKATSATRCTLPQLRVSHLLE